MTGAELGDIAIVGAGQIGTSIGLALGTSEARSKVGSVGVFDDVLSVAVESAGRGAADRVLVHEEEVLGRDTIVLCVPVPEIVRLIERWGDRFRPGTFVIDTGSAKRVVTDAMRSLPSEIVAIGGHPICGTERSGPAAGTSEILKRAPFALTPCRDDPVAAGKAAALVEIVGARPIEVDPATHDRVLARTSHVGHLVAVALERIGSRVLADDNAGLAGPSYRDATRLAGGDRDMITGFLAANLDEVVVALGELRTVLAELEDDLHRRAPSILGGAVTAS